MTSPVRPGDRVRHVRTEIQARVAFILGDVALVETRGGQELAWRLADCRRITAYER